MRRLSLATCIALLLLAVPDASRADEYAAHQILDDLTDLKILQPGQSTSVFDLEAQEKTAIAKLKRLVKTNRRALRARNVTGQTVVMRASEAGLLRLLDALLKLAPHTGDLRAADIRGLTVADHATLAGMRTYAVCDPDYDVGRSDIRVRDSYAAITRAYEVTLSQLMRHRVPTNPRRVATVWLRACPNARPQVRREMKDLGTKNSSAKIQKYLLLEAEKTVLKTRAQRARKRPKIWRAHKSQVAKSGGRPELERQLANAKKVLVGPFKLARWPKGKAVVIAKFSRSGSSPLYGTTSKGVKLAAAIGQRVVSIGSTGIETLKDVEDAVSRLKRKNKNRADIKMLYRHSKHSYTVFVLKNVPLD